MRQAIMFLAGIFCLATACDGPKGSDKFDEDTAVGVADTGGEEVVGCPDGGAIWTGSDFYHFEEHNYTCLSSRITPGFDLDLASFSTAGGYSPSSVESEIENVFDIWNAVGADVNLTIASTTLTGGEVANDGFNEIFMDPGDSESDDDVLATAFTNWDSAAPGATLNCDIVVFDEADDGTEYNFVFNGIALINEFDGTWLLAHETGHCLGLAHNDIFDSLGIFKQSVMFSGLAPADNFVAPMFDLDQEGLLFLYGEAP